MISVKSNFAYALRSSSRQGWLSEPTCQDKFGQFRVLWSKVGEQTRKTVRLVTVLGAQGVEIVSPFKLGKAYGWTDCI